jgi:hypothetical protein
MGFTLLDTIEGTSGIRNENGLIKYQSLPQGVKELSYRRDFLLFKNWWILLEAPLDLDKLKEICNEKGYLLKAEEPVQSSNFMKGAKGFDERLDRIAEMLEASKPDKRFYVYKDGKELICINWYIQNRQLYFSTSKRKGLELAEDYRKAVFE